MKDMGKRLQIYSNIYVLFLAWPFISGGLLQTLDNDGNQFHFIDASPFPHDLSKVFEVYLKHVEFQRQDGHSELYVRFLSKTEYERSNAFHPDFSDQLENKFYGKYFDLENIISENGYTNLTVRFHKSAHLGIIEIIYAEKMDEFEYNKVQVVLYNAKVVLYHNPILSLTTVTDDFKGDMIVANQSAKIICKGIGGFPIRPVSISSSKPIRILNEISEKVDHVTITFLPVSTNDKMKISCSSGNQKTEKTIRVYRKLFSLMKNIVNLYILRSFNTSQSDPCGTHIFGTGRSFDMLKCRWRLSRTHCKMDSFKVWEGQYIRIIQYHRK